MITAHKKNQKTRLSQSTKRTIGLQAIRNEQTITSLSKAHECSRGTVYAQKNKALDAVNQAFEHDDDEILYYIPVTKAVIHQVVLALLLICQSSYRNIMFFLASIFDYSLSLGDVLYLASLLHGF